MPTTPVAANAAPMPDAFPRSPAAQTIDADLLALVLRAKAGEQALAAAEAAFEAAQARLVAPSVPDALVWRPRDRELFPRIDCLIGDPLTVIDVQILRAARDAMHDLARLMGDVPAHDVMEALGRAADIDAVAGDYFEAVAAAREAAGFSAAEAEYERLEDELSRLWREIAFTPACSLLGVLAKLDAVSVTLAGMPLDPLDFPERCRPDDVARMAAADLAALKGALENDR